MRRRPKRCSGRSESGPPPGYDGSACANAALTAAVESAKAHGDGIVVAFGAGAHAVGEDSDQRNLAHTMDRD